MSDQYLPSSTETVKKIDVVNRNKPTSAAISGRILQKGKPIKIGSVGKNLLPSKTNIVGPSSAGKQNAFKPVAPAAVLKPPVTNSERLSNAYELYLQSLLTDLILKETEALKHTIYSDSLVLKCIGSVRGAYKLNTMYANKISLIIFKHVMELAKLANPLQDVVSFKEEEVLAQIQSILSSKFDKIIIQGGVLAKPMFEDIEVKVISERLKSAMQKDCDEKTALQFGNLMNDILNKLDVKIQITEGNNQKGRNRNKMLLESCTFTIMNSHALALQQTLTEDNGNHSEFN